MLLGIIASGRSFIYRDKSMGPKIEPCGTPWINVYRTDSIVAMCALLSIGEDW